MIDQIGGWSSIGTIGSKYGQGYDLDAVSEQAYKVCIRYLDHSKLFLTGICCKFSVFNHNSFVFHLCYSFISHPAGQIYRSVRSYSA